MSWERPVAAWRLADTRMGDTIQAFAARELGDAARWPEIVGLNNLAAPYIVDQIADLGPRTILAGQQLKVPVPQRERTRVASPEEIFGTDLLLQNGRLQVTAEGDLALVSGEPNLAQALRHRLATHLRELLFHPSYGNGMHELRGRKGSPANNMLAAAFADRALRADPRVVTTTDTKATIAGDAITAGSTAVATDGKQLPVGSAE